MDSRGPRDKNADGGTAELIDVVQSMPGISQNIRLFTANHSPLFSRILIRWLNA